MIINPKGMVLIDRRTGRAAGPVVWIKQSESFYRIPRLEQPVWRYMEYWKFESLINEHGLYFRRSDKLEDDMEGKYSEANRKYATDLWERFLKTYPVNGDIATREQGALTLRYHMFINCWHTNARENIKMWKLFGKMPRSVVIVSTVRKLIAAFAGHGVQSSSLYRASTTRRSETCQTQLGRRFFAAS